MKGWATPSGRAVVNRAPPTSGVSRPFGLPYPVAFAAFGRCALRLPLVAGCTRPAALSLGTPTAGRLAPAKEGASATDRGHRAAQAPTWPVSPSGRPGGRSAACRCWLVRRLALFVIRRSVASPVSYPMFRPGASRARSSPGPRPRPGRAASGSTLDAGGPRGIDGLTATDRLLTGKPLRRTSHPLPRMSGLRPRCFEQPAPSRQPTGMPGKAAKRKGFACEILPRNT